ncbi:hypothetical protein ACOMHN_035473 [Nucella lapillus]
MTLPTFLCDQGVKDRINLLLFWLAVTDGLSLTLQLPMKTTCYLSDPTLIHNVHVIVNAKLARMYLCCSFISGTLIVVMSVERCLSVVMPLKARRLLTYSVERCLSVVVPLKARRLLPYRSMVAAILLSYLIPIMGYFPFFLGDAVRWREDPSTNRSIAYMETIDMFSSNRLHRLIANYLGVIGQPVFFIVVVVCNIVTIIHLRRTSRKRSQMTGKMSDGDSSSENKITVMLLFISVVYAILLVSQICSYIIQFFVPEFVLNKKYHNSFVMMYQVFVFTSSCMNSSVNFFAYLALSSRFRKTLKDICFRCSDGRRQMVGH